MQNSKENIMNTKNFLFMFFLVCKKVPLCRKFREVNTFLYHWNRGMLFQKQKIKLTTHLCFEIIYRNILPVQWWRIKDMDLSEKITENVIQCSHWRWEKVTKECVKEVKNAKNEQDVCEEWLMKDKLFNQYEVLEI